MHGSVFQRSLEVWICRQYRASATKINCLRMLRCSQELIRPTGFNLDTAQFDPAALKRSRLGGLASNAMQSVPAGSNPFAAMGSRGNFSSFGYPGSR